MPDGFKLLISRLSAQRIFPLPAHFYPLSWWQFLAMERRPPYKAHLFWKLWPLTKTFLISPDFFQFCPDSFKTVQTVLKPSGQIKNCTNSAEVVWTIRKLIIWIWMNLSLTICPFLMLFKLTRQIGLLDWLFLSYAQKLSGCAKTFELALLPCYEYTMAIFGILSPFLTFENMLKLCILVALALGSFSSTCGAFCPGQIIALCPPQHLARQPGPAKFYLFTNKPVMKKWAVRCLLPGPDHCPMSSSARANLGLLNST